MPPGLEKRDDEPELPQGLDLRELPRGVRAELRGLSGDLADQVGPHLMMAGLVIDEDPELAYRHAMVARRLASRLPVVRAAAAEAAYAAEEYQTALSEFRALRRMTGDQEFLPVMADCERALGRPEEALEIAREAAKLELDPATRVEMRIVEAGARADMGQRNEALRLLRGEIRATNKGAVPPEARARVRYAYADLLLAGGDEAAARDWFQAAAQLDVDHGTDAADRVAALDGFVLEYDESEEYDDREDVASHGDEGAGSDADEVSEDDGDESSGDESFDDESPVADGTEQDASAPAGPVDERDDSDE